MRRKATIKPAIVYTCSIRKDRTCFREGRHALITYIFHVMDMTEANKSKRLL